MNYNNLYSIPLFLVGLTLILLGVRWMVVDEPWMLDEVANIERLEMTFEDLFHPDINKENKDAEKLFKEINQAYKILLKKFLKKRIGS